MLRPMVSAISLLFCLGAVGLAEAEADEACCQAGSSCQADERASAAGNDPTSLLQHRSLAAAGTQAAMATGVRRVQGYLPPPDQDFKEPPVVRSTATKPIHLTLTTVKMCGPLLPGERYPQCWYTRGYSTPELPAQIPGPTIRVKPGEKLDIDVENGLKKPDPCCLSTKVGKGGVLQDIAYNIIYANGFCMINSTNLHTHGLHVTPRRPGDDVFVEIDPGHEEKMRMKLPPYHMAGTHWYHAHRHHSTSAQAGGGALGAIIVEDPDGALPPEVEGMPEKVMAFTLVDMRMTANLIGGSPVPGNSGFEKWSRGHLWKNQTGQYIDENAVVSLVNGQYKPKMQIVSGKWYRFRMIFAAIELNLAVFDAFRKNARCEFQLLAKDGIYLNVAPREVQRLFFASGNRVDVAFRCTCTRGSSCKAALISNPCEPGINSTCSMLPTKAEDMREGVERAKKGILDVNEPTLTQLLLSFDIQGGSSRGDQLKTFSVNRPCYLVDLRGVAVPSSNQNRIQFMDPIDWRVTFSRKNDTGIAMGMRMAEMEDTPPLARMKVGEVRQWYVRGPMLFGDSLNKYTGLSLHVFHIHVNPFQITSLSSPTDPFFQVGDWQDTLFHASGQAIVRTQLDAFTGRTILHCHLLSHEDMGMMGYFDIHGKEGSWWKGARNVDPKCYRDYKGAGYSYVTPQASLLEAKPVWVKGDAGDDCHEACASAGGCAGDRWPETLTELQQALAETGVACEVSPGLAEWHAPSVEGGLCSLAPPAANWSQVLEMRRCGATPPAGVSRLCRCSGLPVGTPRVVATAAY
mmetsp:Transcript_101564/g.255975  ORF Transcript_101564/g.255975 Transcript_101564/m.255975 type:complete len:799 (-) Transcript_101564:63-2459(-)